MSEISYIHIPKPPYSVAGIATWWGLNPDGSEDKGDENADGSPMLGAFGDKTHNEQAMGASIPIIVFDDTVGKGEAYYKMVEERRFTLDVLSFSTGRHVTGVSLMDLGPNARLHRPLDLTYAVNKMLGHTEGFNLCLWWMTDNVLGTVLEIKGWNFLLGMVG